jgi:hypothetical protein
VNRFVRSIIVAATAPAPRHDRDAVPVNGVAVRLLACADFDIVAIGTARIPSPAPSMRS